MLLKNSDYNALIGAHCATPHSILGMHKVKLSKTGKVSNNSNVDGKIVVRAFLPNANSCAVVKYSESKKIKEFPLASLHGGPIFESILDGEKEFFSYQLKIEYSEGSVVQIYDPYAFAPTIPENSIYLFNEGKEYFMHNNLGAHIKSINGICGISFAVWAPSAIRVSVVGNFNFWDGRRHMMRSIGSSGVWEIFIPDLVAGETYKFEILGPDSKSFLKTDPYGKYFESPPHNASIVYQSDRYLWKDSKWLDMRTKVDWKKSPISIYEMHLGSWKRTLESSEDVLSYQQLAIELVEYLIDMNYTHVEFMPPSEHPFDGSWGYQVTGFFAPTQRFGSPDDFKYLIDKLHQNGIGVILDWVPAHFPEDQFALARFDGTALYEHEDPRKGKHQDWGTLIFNYSRNEVKSFLLSNALFWFEHYHIDGLRVDAVSSMLYLDYSRKEGEWIPNEFGGRENIDAIEFLKEVNRQVHEFYPGVLMIAEESTSFEGVTSQLDHNGLGFDFKWNMGWMNDVLHYMKKDPIFRKYEHNNLTFGMLYQYGESFVQVFSHDEVVHGKSSMLMKMPGGTISEKANELRALYALMWFWPGKKTLFMGSDFGQSREWDHNQGLDWHLLEHKDHSGIQSLIRDLNSYYKEIPGIANGDIDKRYFEWIACSDADNGIIAFIRWGENKEDCCIVVAHFTPILRENYRVGVPFLGYYKEILNTGSRIYGGLDFGNNGGLDAESIEWDDRPYSLLINLPPTSVSVFRYQIN